MNKNQRSKNRKKTKSKPQNSNSKISNKIDSTNELLSKEKIKENENNIIQTRKKMIFPIQLGETISKIIIDKLIAITVRICENKEREKKFDNFYFDYILNQMDKLFSINSIFHTEEPEKDESIYANNWKICVHKINTWVEIKEPNSSICDRFEGGLVKNIPKEDKNNQISCDIIESSDKIDLSLKQNKKNNKNNIIDKKTKKRKTLNYYKMQSDLESLEEIGSDSGEEDHIRTKEKKLSLAPNSSNKIIKELEKTKNINIEQSLSLEKIITKKKKYEKIEFKSEDIPGINEELNFDKYAPPEIEILREKIEKELKEKKEQLNKNLLLKKYSVFNKINISKGKIFDSEKLTFDSNGEIIKFKPLKINILANEFKQMKSKLEILNPLPKMSLTKKNFPKMQKIESSTIKPIEKIKIIKNPADVPNTNIELFIKIDPEKKNNFIQSGNNFSLMLPNVGVVLKDEQKIKEGNRDFGKFFNKYSLSDFNKILKEYLPKENKELFQNQFKKMNSTSILINSNNFSSSMNNSNIYNNSFEFPNPLTNQDNNNKENETNLSNLNSALTNKNNFNNINKNSVNYFKNSTMNQSSSFINNIFNSSSITNRNNKFQNFYENQNGFIRLNNINSSSLKLELDSLSDLDIKNRCISPENKRIKFENIFTKKYNELFKNEKKENEISKDLNDLNKQIIKDKNWGSSSLRKYVDKQNLFLSKRQNKSQIFKVLRKNMFNNTKLKQLRERKASNFI